MESTLTIQTHLPLTGLFFVLKKWVLLEYLSSGSILLDPNASMVVPLKLQADVWNGPHGVGQVLRI
jgi:hypothetical protein